MKIAVAALFLALNFYTYHFFATAEVIPPRDHFSEFPMQLGEWRCAGREKMDPSVENNLGVTDYLLCTYAKGEDAVGVYVGYHESQVRRQGGGGRETVIHPPKHCLPGSGWDIVGLEKATLDIEGLPVRPATVNRLVIAKGEQRQLVYYWYQSRGRVIADDWKKIVNLFWDRASRERTDGALVRLTVPIVPGRERHAHAAFQELSALLLPRLPRYLPE